MDLRGCKKNGFVKEVKKDSNLIRSLLKSSSQKLYSQSLMPLEGTTASSKISLAYDSLRELLEALAIAKGFKIYNHECYTSFLNEIMDEKELATEYDKYRKIRNGINYYGKEISTGEAILTLKEMEALIEKMKKKFKEILQ